MVRKFVPSIVCANDLITGKAVWLDDKGQWNRDIHRAQLAETEEQAHALMAIAQRDSGRIAGAWLATATRDAEARTQPTHFREKLRLSGPTFHGARFFDDFPGQ